MRLFDIPLQGYTPLNYDQINLLEGMYSPSMVKSINNKTFAYWQRSLFQRACSIIDFELPSEWEGPVRDFFYYCLFRFGYVGVFDDKERGLCFQPGGLYGFDFYYQPSEFILANPKLQGRFTIGQDPDQVPEEFRGSSSEEYLGRAEIIKLTPDYRGIWDIIAYYAEKLSALDNAINMSIVNNKFSFVLTAKSKAMAESLKKALDKINSGEPAVVLDYLTHDDQKDKNEPWHLLERPNLNASYITDRQLMDFATLIQNFDSEVGIPTLPYGNKRERLVSDEATMKSIDGAARALVWHETLESSLKIVNEAFGSDIKANFRYDPEKLQEGGADNEQSENDIDRA